MNMKDTLYYWIGGEVVTEVGPHMSHENVPCIDTRFNDDWPGERVGMFTNNGWQHIPVEKLPKEFRLQLLIMGVPT